MEIATAALLKNATTVIAKALDETSKRLKAIDAKLDLAQESRLMGSIDALHQAIDEQDVAPISDLARDFQQLALYYHGMFIATVMEVETHKGLLSQGVRRPIGWLKAVTTSDDSLTDTSISMAITSRGLEYLYRERSAALCYFLCNRLRKQCGAVARAKETEMFIRMKATEYHEPIKASGWGDWCIPSDLPYFNLTGVHHRIVHICGQHQLKHQFMLAHPGLSDVARTSQTQHLLAFRPAFTVAPGAAHAERDDPLITVFRDVYGNYVSWDWATRIRFNTPYCSRDAEVECSRMFLRYARFESALRHATNVDDFISRSSSFGT